MDMNLHDHTIDVIIGSKRIRIREDNDHEWTKNYRKILLRY